MLNQLLPILLMGLSVGALSGFFAVGGGSILVPFILINYPQIPYAKVVQISLVVNLINASFNFLRLRQLGRIISFQEIRSLTIGTLIGSLTGQYLSTYFSGQQLAKIFAWIILFTGIRNIYFTIFPIKNDGPKKAPSLPLLLLAGVLGGLLSSMTGLAGGIIFVPLFMIVLKMDIDTMQIFNNTGMAFSCLWSLIFSLAGQAAFNNWPLDIPWYLFFGLLLIPSQLTSKFALQLSVKIPAHRKQFLHGLFLLGMAARLLLK